MGVPPQALQTAPIRPPTRPPESFPTTGFSIAAGPLAAHPEDPIRLSWWKECNTMNRRSWNYFLTSGIVVLALAAAASRADAHGWGSGDCSPPSCHMGWCSNCYGCCDRGCGCCWRSWWGVCGYTPWYCPNWGCGACCNGYCCPPGAPLAPAAPAAAAPGTPTPAPAAPAAPGAPTPAPLPAPAAPY